MQNVSFVIHGAEILRLEDPANRPGVSSEPFDAHRIEEALAVSWINRTVDRVIRDRWRDSARANSAQRSRPGKAPVL